MKAHSLLPTLHVKKGGEGSGNELITELSNQLHNTKPLTKQYLINFGIVYDTF